MWVKKRAEAGETFNFSQKLNVWATPESKARSELWQHCGLSNRV